jgi:hypothetical protein
LKASRVLPESLSPPSQVAHSNVRSLKCGPAETTRVSHIDSPHERQRGRSLTNTIEVKAKSEWGMALSRSAECNLGYAALLAKETVVSKA